MERAYLYCPQIPLWFIPSLIEKRLFWWNDSLARERHGQVSQLFILQSHFQAKTSSWVNHIRFSAHNSPHLDQAVSLNGGGG